MKTKPKQTGSRRYPFHAATSGDAIAAVINRREPTCFRVGKQVSRFYPNTNRDVVPLYILP